MKCAANNGHTWPLSALGTRKIEIPENYKEAFYYKKKNFWFWDQVLLV
jgi:hypothetical protein